MRNHRLNHKTLPTALLAAMLVATVPASAHYFNHQDRHEVCDVFTAPHGHSVTDGHAHWHHLAPAAEAHAHGDLLYDAGHTHDDVFHDPCDQAGMKRVAFEDAPPFEGIPLRDAVIGEPVADRVVAILRDAREAGVLRVPNLSDLGETLLIQGDADLARRGFPGSGTPEDPYVIEGLRLRHVLSIKDTSKCVVVRNNVVWNDALLGPLVDPRDIVDVRGLVQERQAAYEEARAEHDAAQARLLDAEAHLASLRGQLDAWTALVAEATQARDAAAAQAKAAQKGLDDALAALAGRQAAFEDARRALDDAMATSQPTAQPPVKPDAHEGELAYLQWVAAYAAYARDAAHADAAMQERADAVNARADEVAAASAKADDARAARDAAAASRDALQQALDDALAGQKAFLDGSWLPASEERDRLVAEATGARLARDEARDGLDDAKARLSDHTFEYANNVFDTMDEIVDHALKRAPAAKAGLAGRLILDWNGQCVHAYHNMVQDLRVNRNNVRAGFATGGLIEDNRIGVVGQIRHFDGEFRQNEVGDRRYVETFLRREAPKAPSAPEQDASKDGGAETVVLRAGRAINADGFNEAWMHDNLVYGSVDLDFHGHHHGAGFFARESHYHGATRDVGYMVQADGSCRYAYEERPTTLPGGVESPYDLKRESLQCLPHHDHAKRWTSVAFERNVVLDPLGYGVRYEDVNHVGDDRWAPSEGMTELNAPHVHRTHVVIAENVVLGAIRVDTFNADGVNLWSDDWGVVRYDVAGTLADAALHLGADVVNSHKGRNDGWLDVERNAVFVPAAGSAMTGLAALRLSDVKEANRLLLGDNRLHLLGHGFDAGTRDARAFADALRAAGAEDVKAWGGSAPSGVSTAILVERARDSAFALCGTEATGFQRGLVAVAAIRPDATFDACPENTLDGAPMPLQVAITPYPEEKEGLLQPVRDVAADTDAEHVVHALLAPGEHVHG